LEVFGFNTDVAYFWCLVYERKCIGVA